MKRIYVDRTARILAFVLCALILFSFISAFCERKTYTGAWNYMAKLNEFYSMEEDTIDYIAVGSSHMYCSLNPLEVWKRSGVSGFVLATQQQPLVASYHYIKEAFKTQSPKIVVLEGYMICRDPYYEADVLYDAIDPLRFSLNKIQMINNLVEYEQRPEYYFNILKYHSRWSEITASEINSLFTKPLDTYKGFVALDGNFSGANAIPKPNYEETNDVELSQFKLDILNDIKDLVSQNNAQLVLMIAPYDTQNGPLREVIKAEIKWAEENGVPVLDYALMSEEIGIDRQADYYDMGHLDASGAAKISSHFASYLLQEGFSENTVIDIQKWKADYYNYMETFQADIKQK